MLWRARGSKWLWVLVVTDSLGAVAARKSDSFTVSPTFSLAVVSPSLLSNFTPHSHVVENPVSREPEATLSAKLLKLAWVPSYMEGRVFKPLFYRFAETRCKGLRHYKSVS